MRFAQFINETEEELSLSDKDLAAIAQNCQKFLKNTTRDYPLFRGMKLDVPMIELDHPKDRPPRDSIGFKGKAFNWLFNAMIEEAYKVPLVRRKSIFASGSLSMAEGYGDLYFFFPKGDYKFLWSPQVEDSYSVDYEFHDTLTKFLNAELRTKFYSNSIEVFLTEAAAVYPAPAELLAPNMHEKLFELFDSLVTRDPTARGSLTSDSQVFYKSFKRALSRMNRDHFEYRAGDINVAAQSEFEILFNHTDGYYMVEYDAIAREFNSKYSYSGTSDEIYDYLIDQIRKESTK